LKKNPQTVVETMRKARKKGREREQQVLRREGQNLDFHSSWRLNRKNSFALGHIILKKSGGDNILIVNWEKVESPLFV